VNQLDAHHQVVVEKLSRVIEVGPNSANLGGQVDDYIGAGVIQHARNSLLLHQVIPVNRRNKYFLSPKLAQPGNHKTTQKPGSSGYTYPSISPKIFDHPLPFKRSISNKHS
jgi:hypothetical protein